MFQAYRFALEPTPAQERALRSHAGASRFAWNWGLAKCRERYEAERRWFNSMELQKLWNAEKKADPALAWWSENSKCVYQGSFRDLDRALRGFVTSKRGERKGRRVGFPRFKKRGKCRDSFRLGADPARCSGTTVTLAKLGTIRTHESTRKLARRVENGTARILAATVSRTAQRWFVSFTVEVQAAIPERHARPGSAVGIDLGVKTLLTGVDDAGNVITVHGPRALRASMHRLRRTGRAQARKQLGSANRRKHNERLARIHARVTSIRADAIHKATTDLAARYETVVVEDLNVSGLLRNRRVAQAVGDQGLGQAGRLLTYKTEWNGGRLIKADRWFPSSKTCSGCGAVKTKLPLRVRVYRCETCGLVLDRDVNAARNLLYLGTGSGPETGPVGAQACGDYVSPGPAGQRPLKQEPGTAPAGQTGTVLPQGRAAA